MKYTAKELMSAASGAARGIRYLIKVMCNNCCTIWEMYDNENEATRRFHELAAVASRSDKRMCVGLNDCIGHDYSLGYRNYKLSYEL